MDSLKEEEALGSRTTHQETATAAAGVPNGRSEQALTEINTNGNKVSAAKERKTNKKKLRRKYWYLPKIGCLKIEQDEEGNFDAEVETIGEPANPAHLVVMVNGVIGRLGHSCIFFFPGRCLDDLKKCGLVISNCVILMLED